MKWGIIIGGITLLLLLSSVGGAMGSNVARDAGGRFIDNIFDNGRVTIDIGKEYSKIMDSKSNAVLVEKFYPIVEVNNSGKWRAISFGEEFVEENEHEGWHSVAIGMVYRGKNLSIHGFLQYYQKDKFRRYAPLYPSMQLWFNKSVEYRIVWRYEGIKIRHIEVIDNGSGWTRPPYRHGHGRTIIYNGTINRDMVFRDGQDIVIGYKDGKKMFGLNWEKSKEALPVLRIKNGDDLSMSIESDPEVGTVGVDAVPPGPIPDTGSGGGSNGDTDGDGLTDSQEEAGWYIWVIAQTYNKPHHIHVTSDPYDYDTDGDGLDDGVEYDHGTNPRSSDTDSDGLTDKQEIDYYGTCGYVWDTDGDELSDSTEVNGWDISVCTSGTTWTQIHVTSDPNNNDTDGDGVDDKEEYDYGTNPQDNDTDNDGLTDYQEIYGYHTYGYTWDSDGDGISDLDEFSWLFMVYADGDNNLDEYSILTDIVDGLNGVGNPPLYEERVKTNKIIHVVAEYDGPKNGDSERNDIKAVYNPYLGWYWSIEVVENMGELNMGDGNTLSDFISWAANRYSAANKMLIIADHGGGWVGISWDYSQGHAYIDMGELKNALASAGVHFNIIGFDACLMQMNEVLYQIGNYADIVIASEEEESTGAWNYNRIFHDLSKNYVIRDKPIYNQDIVNETLLVYSNYTLSAVDTNNVKNDLTSKVDTLAVKLKTLVEQRHGGEIKNIISQTQHMHVDVENGDFYNHSYRDLYDFAERIRNYFGADSDVGRAAYKVMEAIICAVIKETHNNSMGDYHGISIFLPDDAKWYKTSYETLDFSSATGWADFLTTLYGI